MLFVYLNQHQTLIASLNLSHAENYRNTLFIYLFFPLGNPHSAGNKQSLKGGLIIFGAVSRAPPVDRGDSNSWPPSQ